MDQQDWSVWESSASLEKKKKHSEANEANWKQVTEPRLHVKRFNGPKARIGKGEALA